MTRAAPIRRPAVPQRMSYEQFLAFPHENQHVEWVDGKVIPMPAVSDPHTAVTTFLITVLNFYVDRKHLGVVRHDPFNMKTGPDLPGRQPDVLFVHQANITRLQPTHLAGPADLVVEVISPGTRRTDRVEKFQEYERGGVSEYLIIDPERRSVELYRLTAGRYDEVQLDESGVLRSEVLEGFYLRPSWVLQVPTASVSEVLVEPGVMSAG